MPDPNLHGNGESCPACDLRRQMANPWSRAPIPCNQCGGGGRLAFTAEAIVAATVEQARATYWPAVDARQRRAG